MTLISSEALGTHRRVLSASFLREIDLTLGKNPFSFVAALLEPVAMIAFMCGWHYLIAIRPPYGTDIVLFFSTGYYPYYIFLYLSQASRLSKSSGPLRRFPVEKSLEAILASAMTELITYVMVGVVLFGFIYFWLTHAAYPWNWTYILESMGALTLLGIGAGLCSTVIEHFIPWWRFIWMLTMRLIHVLAGVLMVPDLMPTFIRDYVVWIPVLHGVSRFRQGIYPQYPHFVYSGTYMWLFAFGLLVLGLCLLRIYRREIG